MQQDLAISIGNIVVKPSAIARVLAAVALLLILASTAGQFMKYFAGHPTVKGLVPLFYVEEERNIPTFFSVLLLLSAAFVLTIITRLGRTRGDVDASKWMILAFGFLYLAVDELLSFHEKLTMPIRRLLPDLTGGVLFFSWVIPAIVAVSIIAVFFLRFLFRLPARTRSGCLLAAALYLGGAIGFELIEGRYRASNGDVEDFTFAMMATAEESLEMFGVIFLIYTLLKHIALTYKDVLIRIDDSGSS